MQIRTEQPSGVYGVDEDDDDGGIYGRATVTYWLTNMRFMLAMVSANFCAISGLWLEISMAVNRVYQSIQPLTELWRILYFTWD